MYCKECDKWDDAKYFNGGIHNESRLCKYHHTLKILNKRAKKYKDFTGEQFLSKLQDQEFSCQICKKEFTDLSKVSIDHCHTSNQVRDLLCNSCNTAIGFLKEDEDIIKNALEYIKKFKYLKGNN